MRITNHYIYPSGSLDQLLDLVVDQLTAYLEDPTGAGFDRLGPTLQAQAQVFADAANATGLLASPQFVLRPGTGAVGDEPVIGPAGVIYGNQDVPGVPYCRVIVENLGEVQDWDSIKNLQPIQFVIDAYADEWAGLLNDGREATDAGSQLQGALYALLSPTTTVYPLLKTWGFTDPKVRPGAGVFEGIELFRPFTFACELYVAK